MTLTTEWGPMTRVIARSIAQRAEDAQRGTRWLVSRVVCELVQYRDKRGDICPGKERYTTRVTYLGEVYADNKNDALAEAKKYWIEDNLSVQSAISAQLTKEETAAVERLRHRRTMHYGRGGRPRGS